jgi:hypothetical protein
VVNDVDPDACLREILTITTSSVNGWPLNATEGDRLAELVHSLDDWLSNGGFLPKRWQR